MTEQMQKGNVRGEVGGGGKGGGGGNVDDCTGVGMERDSAHADGSREHISKVCSQLIIGTPPPPIHPRVTPFPRPLSLSPSAHRGKDEVPRFEASVTPADELAR